VTGSVHSRRLLADVRQSQVSSFLGTDGAGVVVAEGPRATRFRLGDRVYVSSSRSGSLGWRSHLSFTRGFNHDLVAHHFADYIDSGFSSFPNERCVLDR
jgi:NADPH:quinone reductase-like Zn-dependent oxidoreductase